MAQVVAQAPEPVVADAPATRARPRREVPDVLLVLAVLLALLPIAVGTARALHQDWFPIGDNSLVYIRTTDVFTGDTPALFLWSAGSAWADQSFNNPGPALYWVFAGPVAVLGPSGLAVATALLNAAAIAALAVVGRRRGGPLVGLAAVAVGATLTWTMGSGLVADPWPPNSLLLLTVLYLALVWSVADGDLPAVPFAAGVGTLLLQTNLSYAMLAPGVALWAAVALALHLRRERRRHSEAWPAVRRRMRRVGWATAAVLAVLWTPSVVEQLTADDTGNLTRIARGMGDLPLTLGPTRALQLVVRVVALPGWWLRGSFYEAYADPPSTALAVVGALALGALLGGLVWLGVRHRDRVAVTGIATAAAALTFAFVTAARSPVGGFGDLHWYRTRFLWAIAAFTTLVVVVAVARRLPRMRQYTLGASWVLVAVTAVVAITNLPYYWSNGTHEPGYAFEVVRDLRDQLADLDPDQRILFAFEGDSRNYPFWAYAVVAELARQDVPFVVEGESLVRSLGEHRRHDGDDADVEMVLRTGDHAFDTPRRARRVAFLEGLSPRERSELETLRDRVISDLDTGEVQLTEEGARILSALRPGGEARRSGSGRPLVDGRHIGDLMAQGFFELDGAERARFERYLALEAQSDERTLAVFVRPLGSTGSTG